MADGLAKHELDIIFKAAQKALSETHTGTENRKAVQIYLRIRLEGEDQDRARQTFLGQLPRDFPKKNDGEIESQYKPSLQLGEKLWHEAFENFYW